MPWQSKEEMSAHDPSSWSKVWFSVDDVGGSGSREDKAQEWVSLNQSISTGTFFGSLLPCDIKIK